MKKLFLIRYTYQSIYKPEETTHYDDNYYLCNNLEKAMTDIRQKFNHGTEVKITQFEEIYYKEI